MRTNPEFQRNLWLEFSPHRLMAMPAVLALIFIIAMASDQPAAVLSYTSYAAFALLAGLWGGHRAAETVLDEANGHTWDFQRLSSMSPWELVWGKLLGSTAYSWYGALMALLVYFLAAASFMPFYQVLVNIVILLTAAFCCHAAALISSMQAIRASGNQRSKIPAIGHHLVGICVAAPMLSAMYKIRYFAENELYRRPYTDMFLDTIEWFGHKISRPEFLACFFLLLLIWLLRGAYAQMRHQLKMHTGPALWAWFEVFILFFITGLFWTASDAKLLATGPLNLGAALVVSFGFLYAIVFLESWSGLTYRQLKNARLTGHKEGVQNNFPRWAISLGITIAVLAVHVLTADSALYRLMPLAWLGFALRDIAILHYFKLYPSSRRATRAAIFYGAVLYVLIPLLLNAIGLDVLNSLFVPIIDTAAAALIAILSGFVQAAIVAAMAYRRWQRHWVKID